MGLTPITAGRLRVMLPAKPNPLIRHSPQIVGDAVTGSGGPSGEAWALASAVRTGSSASRSSAE
jgi:hypothetical protein